MRAEYDSAADAISIVIADASRADASRGDASRGDASRGDASRADASRADASDEVHARGIVALSDGKPVEVQILYPDMGITEPLYAASARHGLDLEALTAAAQSALAAPDRIVVLEVAARVPA
jgi:hypothetical protein